MHSNDVLVTFGLYNDAMCHSFLFQTFLGIKVEQELQRKQADRRGRRENYGDIKMKKVQAYGKLCSPFKALSVPVSMVVSFCLFVPCN